MPWRRLAKEWLIYAAIMAVIFAIFFRDGNIVAILGGLLVSGPLYLGLGYVLAKFGYTAQDARRTSTRHGPGRRSARQAARRRPPTATVGTARPRPAPTRRTSAGRATGRRGASAGDHVRRGAIDAGTTGVRSRAVFIDGSPSVASPTASSPSTSPSPGWVEHDADEIWDAVARHARRGRRPASAPAPVAAIGITNQRETVVAWDRAHRAAATPGHRVAGPAHGRPLRRAGRRRALDLVRQRTGLVLDPYFSGTKIEWLLARGRRARRPPTWPSARSTPGCSGT